MAACPWHIGERSLPQKDVLRKKESASFLGAPSFGDGNETAVGMVMLLSTASFLDKFHGHASLLSFQ